MLPRFGRRPVTAPPAGTDLPVRCRRMSVPWFLGINALAPVEITVRQEYEP